jgi:phosphomannomutase
MKQLRISIGGVRGIIGEALTPDIACAFAGAFGTYLGGGRVLVSRDTRLSGPMVAHSVLAGLLGAGCEVVDLGVCPTAAMQLAIRDTGASGGLAVTAGHNDGRWNALKFIRDDGIFLNPREAEELLDIYHQGEFTKATWSQLKPVRYDPDAAERHLSAIVAQVDRDAIASARLRVAVDCVNGACTEYAPRLLEMLGCVPLAINVETDAGFAHAPEPSQRNLGQLRALVQASGAQVGFAHDADGDRLAVVCENGIVPGEEVTLCLVEEMVLSRGDAGPVVTNVCTTRAVDDIAERHGRRAIHTYVGQAYIAEAAVNHGAAVAGEGSGGVLLPGINYANDSIAAMAHILELLAKSGRRVSGLIAEVLPTYHIVKLAVPCPVDRAFGVLARVREAPPPSWAESRNLNDGVKYVGSDRWVHVRASQTEPLVRVIAEACDVDVADGAARDMASLVRRSMT